MSNQQKSRIQIPDALREILLEFSITYLVEQPGDVIDYGTEFFNRLQENRRLRQSHDEHPASPDESELLSLDEGKTALAIFFHSCYIFFIIFVFFLAFKFYFIYIRSRKFVFDLIHFIYRNLEMVTFFL